MSVFLHFIMTIIDINIEKFNKNMTIIDGCSRAGLEGSEGREFDIPTIEYKVKVVKFAKIDTNQETRRKYKINKSVVRKWKQQKAELQNFYAIRCFKKKVEA